MSSSSRVSPCVNEMCCCFPLALLLYFWLLRYYFKTTYFCLQKCIKSEIYVLSSFRSHQIGNKNYGVFPIVQRKHFPWDIRQKGIHCGCKPGLAKRNSLNIFFQAKSTRLTITTTLLSTRRKLFLQINTAASILDCSNIYRRIILPQMC